MGQPDQGKKAQTPVRYSHGTGIATGGPVTAVTGVIPRVTLGVEILFIQSFNHSFCGVLYPWLGLKSCGRSAAPAPRGSTGRWLRWTVCTQGCGGVRVKVVLGG